MSETTTPPQTDAPQQQAPNNKAKLALLLLLLLIILAGLGYAFSGKNTNKELEDKIISLEQAKVKSDSLYNNMKKELASYKQNNEDLYEQLADKEEELEQYYGKIKRLIAQAERDKASNKAIQIKLQKLSQEINGLKIYVDNQTKDIEELRQENIRLKKEKEALEEKVKKSQQENDNLKNSSSNLKEENENLAEKIDEAEVLRIVNMKAAGLRTKTNGKRVGISFAKRTEIIETCFEIVPNKVTPVGVNRFYLRLIDPAGFTVQDRNRGSGRLTTQDAKRIDYTVSKTFDYDPGIFSLCMEWSSYPTTPFSAGEYTIEIYNKGRKVSSKNFTMK